MMSSDDNLLPELKQVNNYISVIEFLCGSLYNDCNLSLLPGKFVTQLLTVTEEVRQLRNVYINSLKFQSYE